METITITKRIINGKEVYNKRFDDYDEGFYGKQISKRQYNNTKLFLGLDADNGCNRIRHDEFNSEPIAGKLYIVERITYEN